MKKLISTLAAGLFFCAATTQLHAMKKNAIFRAVRERNLSQVENILKKKPEVVNEKLPCGWTPLHLAANRGYKKIVQRLIGYGANIDEKANKRAPIDLAYENNQNDLVDYLRARGAKVSFYQLISGPYELNPTLLCKPPHNNPSAKVKSLLCFIVTIVAIRWFYKMLKTNNKKILFSRGLLGAWLTNKKT